MALNSKLYTQMFTETGSDGDKISSDEKDELQAHFNSNDYLVDRQKFESQGHLLLQINNITKELDYLRDLIAANQACCSVNSKKTGITTAQANAINVNTAKKSGSFVADGANLKIEFKEGDKENSLILIVETEREKKYSTTLNLK